MESKIRRGLTGLVFGSLAIAGVVAAGCSSPSEHSEEPSASSGEAVEVAASGVDAGFDDASYTFFVVSKTPAWQGGGYDAQIVGRPYTKCPDGWYSPICHVDSIDMSVLGLLQADSDAIVAQIGTSRTKETLLFVGTLAATHPRRGPSTTSLVTQEVWRAPQMVSIDANDDSWFHVSHEVAQALKINTWQKRTVTSLDLEKAPLVEDCDPDPDSGQIVCVLGHTGVTEDAETPAGIVVDGAMDRDGTIHVKQFYAKIGIGYVHLDNGYWYCRADQYACPNVPNCMDTAQTSGTCNSTHFHGDGLDVYKRTPVTVVQPWLVQTAQLTTAESQALTGH
jgi:hypothetical protein